VFGFGVGKIELKLPKTTYAAGEAIEGTLLLTVNKPVKARGLFATLYAEQQIREQVLNQGKMEMRTETRKIYNYQQQLDTEKEYLKTGEASAYPFSITMPPMAGVTQDIINPLHGFTISFGGLQIGGGPGPIGPAQWMLEGYLDLPLALDVKAKVNIGIRLVS
jgi:hypothetical protein